MDKKCICHLRSIYRAITALEQEMQKLHGININEGMLLCLLSENKSLTSGEIAEALGLTCSNTSKIICAVEKKELISRIMGKTDKREMYFSLSAAGKKRLKEMKECDWELPEILTQVLEKTNNE
jgi:putative transcriptional regulator